MSNGEVTRSQVAWRPLLAVLAVIALLTGGWTLASRPLPDTAPVAAGTELSLGPEGAAAVTVTGDGWQQSKAATIPDQTYVLRRNGVELSVLHVDLPSQATEDELWSGFRQVARTSGGRLGDPIAATTEDGHSGQSGPIRRHGRTGTAYAFLAPGGDFAIEATVLAGPPADAADVSAAEQVVQSLTFPDGAA